jgi:hypothetical protein
MPLLPGCDSRAILTEAGISEDEIDSLVAEGVIGSPQAQEEQRTEGR